MQKIIAFSFAMLLVIGLAPGAVFAKNPGKGPGKGQGSVVSQAVHKAHEEGLKGEGIAAAAHKAIEERNEGREKGAAVKGKTGKKHRMAHKQGKKHKKIK